MARTVHCAYLDKEAEGLDMAPWPGELGQKVLENISKEAWQEWMRYQTMLINEKRLKPMDKEHRKYLAEQMEKFLFGGEVDEVAGYTPKGS
jgi:Fe-S cluster biosynthesis and repair protein YggX